MSREIGSEFWEPDIIKDKRRVFETYHEFVLSGRTALDIIIKDIKVTKTLNKIYMPSYCCHTMIKPFIENSVEVVFYDIYFENGQYTYDIDYNIQCDAILIMQYFGYHNSMVSDIIRKFKENNIIIIEDATHSWFQKTPYSLDADYIYASFRKWTGLPCGAIIIKKDNGIKVPIKSINTKYIDLRSKAAKLKQEYITKEIGEKEEFLKVFAYAEEYLEYNYAGYGVTEDIKDIIMKLDSKKITEKRVENASYLINKLKRIKNLDIVTMSDKDTPLFVPIIFNDGKRDELRANLINNSIYCPNHWPLTSDHRINDSYLYENSLSLVCDQRYGIEDMKRIVRCIYEFYGG